MTTKDKLIRLSNVLAVATDKWIESSGRIVSEDQAQLTRDQLFVRNILGDIMHPDDKITHVALTRCNDIYKRWSPTSPTSPEFWKEQSPTTTHDFKNKQFCFTGFRDALLENKLNTHYNSTVHKAVGGTTILDYLICRNKSKQTIKMTTAISHGATILTYSEFKKLMV